MNHFDLPATDTDFSASLPSGLVTPDEIDAIFATLDEVHRIANCIHSQYNGLAANPASWMHYSYWSAKALQAETGKPFGVFTYDNNPDLCFPARLDTQTPDMMLICVV